MIQFCIVIATYSRPQQLKLCLEALAQLDTPHKPFEVIVVDDGTPGGLAEVVQPFAAQLHLRLLVQSNAGQAAARNRAASQTQADYLAFTDDDCQPAPDWLTTAAKRLATAPDCLIGGHTINRLKTNVYSEASQLIVDRVYAFFNADPQKARFFASNNMIVPAAQFAQLGGFNTAMRTSEDRDLCERWLERGWRMIYAPECKIYHAHDLTLVTFARQHFGYGRGAFAYHKLRSVRQAVPSLTREMSFHRNLDNWLLYPLKYRQDGQRWALFALLIVWQVANLAGYLWQAVRAKRGA